MSGDEHVHGGEGAAPFPGGGAQVGVGFCGSGVPSLARGIVRSFASEFSPIDRGMGVCYAPSTNSPFSPLRLVKKEMPWPHSAQRP